MFTPIRTGLAALFAFLLCLQHTLAASASSTRWITYQNSEGETVYLEDNRRPSLYTGNFGDCLGGSSINVTRFDAAYYKDNMTVLFHLAGNSALYNESLMMYIGVYAYGEDRFDLIFNPCNANIYSLCPINSSIPITAEGIIPVAPSDVANIPNIALSIPDFEGEAILRIFSNLTQQEIACYSAVVTNGATFSHPDGIGSVLGVFTFVALVASFATAIYGEAVPTMRLHYAHSLSVGVVFAVWQHIFFSGALSMNWPSVLVAWYSNFAWAAGMIYSSSMQKSINNLIGNNVGNTSQVGAAQAGSANSGVGGGYDISAIYKRAFGSGLKRGANRPLVRDIASEIYNRDASLVLKRDIVQRTVERALQARDNTIVDASEGYHWYGQPVGKGFPLPGNYSGFAGTLAEENILASNAFMTGFLWFLILLVLMVASVIAFKWILEGMVRYKWAKEDRLKFFRDHWVGYTGVVALRTCFIAWFMMLFLTMFQFTYNASGGVIGIAAIVFIIFLVGVPAVAAYAYWYKLNVTDQNSTPANKFEHNKLLRGKYPIPQFSMKKTAQTSDAEVNAQHSADENKRDGQSLWKRVFRYSRTYDRENQEKSIHDDDDYTTKFGWLASRYRRTRWWFFATWLFYEFLRAIFYGGASGNPLAQVFGLLIIEVAAFGLIVWARPFEGQRLNVLVIYCLGFSKVATVALSAAFATQFSLQRIPTTVIGIVIIVIQGILTIITMIAIVVGAVSSYMSVSRNRDDFRPRKWHGLREKYFDHLDRAVNDLSPPSPPPEPAKVEPEEAKYGFEMRSVRRIAKIEDEDGDFMSEMNPNASYASVREGPDTPTRIRSNTGTPVERSRANSRAMSTYSISQTTLPYGARPHRPSWSTRDFREFTPVEPQAAGRPSTPIDMSQTLIEEESVLPPPPSAGNHSRTPSRSATLPTKLQPQPSMDSLRIGGEVSTRDTIGNVPAPTVRPRAGTSGSRKAARSISSSHGYIPEGSRSSEQLSSDDAIYTDSSRPPSLRNSMLGLAYGRNNHLTPAQEQEEWALSRTNTRSEEKDRKDADEVTPKE
ncbi:hypothetical protein DOTSEDRAFT_67549 [Lecanosticta acicola]|uniref:ML-like domain-containing protein n=1 Tax=Lecanosticta acicola TaxID=111012 RepID=A0AAI9E8V9_9PEZI|nr:hypothetical protein DOTSEDRAFT_67549 [Lecanosticta acicola]